MTDNSAVPLIVFSPQREPSEFINSLMRKAGEPVHCTWIPAVRDLGEALEQLNPELLVCAYVSESDSETGGDRARPARAAGADAAGAAADFRRRHRHRHAHRRARCRVAVGHRSRAGRGVARAALLPARARAQLHAAVRQRLPPPAAIGVATLQRRHPAGAGRHRGRCQPDLARAVRLRRCGRGRRPAAHGSVRRSFACRAQGRAGRLRPGQVDRSSAESDRPARRRHATAARPGADSGRIRERTLRAHHGARAKARRSPAN